MFFNKRQNITGVLYYFPHNNTFYQRLEGEENKVKELFQKIKADERHYDVQMQRDMPGHRIFTHWSMHFEPKVDFYVAFSAGFQPDMLYRNTLYLLNKTREAAKQASIFKALARSSEAGSPRLSVIDELSSRDACIESSPPYNVAGTSTKSSEELNRPKIRNDIKG